MPSGGFRKNAGRHVKHKEGTKPKTFRFPLSIARHIESKPNQTEYVTYLVEADINKEKK